MKTVCSNNLRSTVFVLYVSDKRRMFAADIGLTDMKWAVDGFVGSSKRL